MSAPLVAVPDSVPIAVHADAHSGAGRHTGVCHGAAVARGQGVCGTRAEPHNSHFVLSGHDHLAGHVNPMPDRLKALPNLRTPGDFQKSPAHRLPVPFLEPARFLDGPKMERRD
jgi:hypothetical protein